MKLRHLSMVGRLYVLNLMVLVSVLYSISDTASGSAGQQESYRSISSGNDPRPVTSKEVSFLRILNAPFSETSPCCTFCNRAFHSVAIYNDPRILFPVTLVSDESYFLLPTLKIDELKLV